MTTPNRRLADEAELAELLFRQPRHTHILPTRTADQLDADDAARPFFGLPRVRIDRTDDDDEG